MKECFENRKRWLLPNKNRVERDKLKTIFRQTFSDQKTLFKDLSLEFLEILKPNPPIKTKEIRVENLVKMIKHIVEFAQVLSGNMSIIIDLFSEDQAALLIVFLSSCNPLMSPEISDLFFISLETRSPGLYLEEIMSSLKNMILNKTDSHLMIQDLLRLKYFSIAFHIGKLCFFSNRLFPKTTQSEFGNKQYMAHLADILLDHLIAIEADFGVFMGYYDYTYNFTDRLDVKLLLRVFLANLGHPELPSYCAQHMVLRRILDKALFHYISQVDPECSVANAEQPADWKILSYVQSDIFEDNQMSQTLLTNTLKIQSSSLFLHLAFCKDNQISNLLLELILRNHKFFEKGFLQNTLVLMSAISDQFNTPHNQLISQGPFKTKMEEFDRLENSEEVSRQMSMVNENGIPLSQPANQNQQIHQNFFWLMEIVRLAFDKSRGVLAPGYCMAKVSRIWGQFGPDDVLIAAFMLLVFSEMFESQSEDFLVSELRSDLEEFLEMLTEWKGYFRVLPNYETVYAKIDKISDMVLESPDLDSF